MSDPGLVRNAGLAFAALISSSATLVCCVLPATLVALGAGATLASLVAAVPQLIWLSEHKLLTFGVAGGMLVVSGAALWVGWRAPCPADPRLARACRRLRLGSLIIYAIALLGFLAGAVFAFVIPAL